MILTKLNYQLFRKCSVSVNAIAGGTGWRWRHIFFSDFYVRNVQPGTTSRVPVERSYQRLEVKSNSHH